MGLDFLCQQFLNKYNVHCRKDNNTLPQTKQKIQANQDRKFNQTKGQSGLSTCYS